MMKSRGAEAVMHCLVQEGVTTLFGYPGGAIMPIYDALFDFKDTIQHVLVRHEQGAIHAAQGYARTSGKVGVCFATSGPGATNLITGLADAMIDSTPVVCVTGQVASHLLGTDAFQETDVIGISMPVTKWNIQVTKAEDIAPALAKAFYIARTGRQGPVLVDITKDAQFGMVDFVYEPCTSIRSYSTKPTIDPFDLNEAVELINSAKRPYLVVGQGIYLSNAEQALFEFAEKSGIPVASTLLGLGAFPTNHEQYVGYLGMHGNYAPNVLTNECDVLIAVGMRFDDRVTGDVSRYAKQAKVIHIDIDKAELNKIVPATVALHADAREALVILTKAVVAKNHGQWLQQFKDLEAVEANEIVDAAIHPTSEELKMAEVVHLLSEQTDGKAIIVTDVAIIGDGGFQMTLQELGTILQAKVDVKIMVLNNNFLGMVRQWQQLFFDRRYSFTEIVNPDFGVIAKAYSIQTSKITERHELEIGLKEMLHSEGAFFLEVVVQQEENVFPMIETGASVSEIRLN